MTEKYSDKDVQGAAGYNERDALKRDHFDLKVHVSFVWGFFVYLFLTTIIFSPFTEHLISFRELLFPIK